MNKNILVTGGAGYIGSHNCKMLSQKGYNPIVYDNLIRGNSSAVKWGPLEIGDILDKDRLQEVIDYYNPLAVMHFAAYAYIGESVEDPFLYYHNNINGTINLLEVIVKNKIKYFVFSSTCAIYGAPLSIPILESHTKETINPYGNTKLIIERILNDISQRNHFYFTSLRYFNAAGSDPDTEIGEDHKPETHLIPRCLDALINNTKIEIFGDDYNTKDGTCIRDYIHVNDIARAHILSLEYLIKENKSISVNLGNNKGYSVKEIIHEINTMTEKELQYIVTPKRIGDPDMLIGSNDLAKEILGWVPEYSLHDMIHHAYLWKKKNNE